MQNVHKCPPEELNDVDKGYYYNEARFLRAHFYAMMLPVYGPVFLIGDDPVDFTQSGLDQRERNTWDECVNYVANELWEAAKGLPTAGPTSTTAVPRKAPPGRPRPPAALLGRQALQRQRTLQGYRQQKRRPPVPDPVRRKEMGAGSPGRQRRYEPEPLLAGRRRRHGPLRQLQHALHVGRFRDRRYGEDLHAHRQRLPVAYSHHAPECRRNGLRRLRRNPETGRRVRHGQRPLPHHGLHRRRPGAADHRPRRRLQRKRILEVQAPDLRRRTGDVQNVPEPRTALLRQRVLERHDLARSQQENSQRPVLFQRQFGSGKIAQLSADGLSGA